MRFTVYGVPIPKGSAKGFKHRTTGRVIVTHDNLRTKPWQQAVVDAAREVLGDGVPLEGPVSLGLDFYLPRPKSTPKRVRRQTARPDLDKLIRTVKDGLTRAGIYRDDAQVVTVIARKDFACGDYDELGERGVPRVEIVVAVVEAA